jgi:acetyl esterase/lipase
MLPARAFPAIPILLFATLAGGAEIKSFPDLTFATPDGRELKLDLSVPVMKRKPPIVVYVHGGSWIGGSRKGNPFLWLTESGFAVASVDYRFSTEALFPAQLNDCRSAIEWLRKEATKYGYDASRIVVIGTSAGGHLAVLLGTTDGGASSRVQGVIDFFGPTDFILRSKDQPEMTDPPGSRVHRLLGLAPKNNLELAKAASGAWQVSRGDAPMLIFHGAADTTVLPNQSARLYEAAMKAGVESTLHVLPGAKHDVKPFLQKEEFRSEIVQFLNRTLRGGN